MKGVVAEFTKHVSFQKLFKSKDEISFSICIPFLKQVPQKEAYDSIYPIHARGLLLFPSLRKTRSLVGAYVGATFYKWLKYNSCNKKIYLDNSPKLS
jgi:hypothetical protein